MKYVLLALFIMGYMLSYSQPHRSYPYLTTSNGLIVAVYNEDKNMVETVFPHIFANYDSGKFVHPFAGKIKLNTDERPTKVAYADNTHVIEATYKNFSVSYFASFTQHDKVFYAQLTGKTDAIKNLSFTYESGENTRVSEVEHLVNPFEPLPITYSGKAITGNFSKKINGSETEKYFLLSFVDTLHTNAKRIEQTIQQLKNTTSLAQKEKQWMKNIFARCHYPKGISTSEKNAVEQSISILKMGQVSDYEIFPLGRGQILASLRPGLWHIAWVRDASYAIQALAKLGLYDEAKKGLEFMLKAKANLFKHYYFKGKDYGTKVDYQISLTRYFGNGVEECDYNEYGPNIEYDDWGLFLTAFTDYVSISGDINFYKKWNDVVRTKVADAIIACMDTNDLVFPDSGPWEHHLRNVKQYTFTNSVSAKGLLQFADCQKKVSLPSEKYYAAGEKIKQSMLKNLLVDGHYFKGNAQDSQPSSSIEYYDGGVFEIFANGLVINPTILHSHVAEYANVLRVKGDREGYIRMNSGDDVYENQEWGYLDLRVANAYILVNEKPKARAILNYVTEQAAYNHNHIPEMYSYINLWKKSVNEYSANNEWCYCIRPRNDELVGAVPMVGYGAGAYIISLYNYYEL